MRGLASMDAVPQQGGLMAIASRGSGISCSISVWKCALLVAGFLFGASLPVNAATVPGHMAGSFSVTPGGAANYTIPLLVAPGPNGVQPNIALVYDNNGGPGYVSRGWKISGLSGISRCRRSIVQDGAASPVKLQASDAYCLDGNRLRSVGGTYGYTGSVYATEIADFSRVEVTADNGAGPLSFEVWRKDGLIYTYGGTTDSRVIATGTNPGVPHTWMVSQIRDRDNNRVVLTYKTPDSTTTGTTHPLKIEWAATSKDANTWLYKMEFAYGANAWSSSYFGNVAGTEVKDTDLLTAITVTESGNVRRKYVLTYSNSPNTGSKQLTHVYECSDASGSTCLAPTNIQYGADASAVDPGNPGLNVPGYNLNPTGIYDINGDHFADLIYARGSNGYVRFGSAGGYGSEVNASTAGYGVANFGMRGADLYNNGHDVFIFGVPGAPANVQSYAWNGSAFAVSSLGFTLPSNALDYLPVDVNGDKYADVVTVTGSTSSNNITLNVLSNVLPWFGTLWFLPTGSYGITLAPTPVPGRTLSAGPSQLKIYRGSQIQGYRGKYDQDRDGVEDLVIWATYQACNGSGCVDAKRGWSLLSGSNYSVATQIPIADSGLNYPKLADLNGDDCMDSYSAAGNVVIAGCNGVASATVSTGVLTKGAVDWNADGRQDLVTYSSSDATLKVLLFQGGSFSTVPTAIPADPSCEIVKADANGDELEEIGCLTSSQLYLYYHQTASAIDQACFFVGGSGENLYVFYGDISQGNYVFDTTVTSPRQALHGGVRVVTGVYALNFLTQTWDYSITYSYANATTNTEGRGFEGFERFESVDSRNNIKRVRRYAKDFPNTGSLIEDSSYQSGGAPISVQTFSPASLTLSSAAGNQRYFAYSNGSDQTIYEVAAPGSFGASLNGQPITRTITTMTPDVYGNATTVSTAVTDMDATSPYYGQSSSRTVTRVIVPDDTSGHWCLGLPESVTVTDSASGTSNIVRSQSFTNDYAKCRVLTAQAGSGNRRVDTTYGYDSFGNPNSISVQGRDAAGGAMAARTASVTWGSANGTAPGTGQFPVSQTDAMGKSTSRTFNAGFGTLATETDPNGIVVVTNQFDGFGRTIRRTRADGTSTTWSFHDCTSSDPYTCRAGDPNDTTDNGVDIVIASERDASDNEIRDDWTYLDRYGRPTAQKSRTLSGAYSWKGRQYDLLGRVSQEMAPCNAASCTIYWTTNTYDPLGRLVSQSRRRSESDATLVATTFGYAGRTQRVTDAEGKHSTKILDITGRMRRSQDHHNYYQDFSYDAAGSLLAVTDSLSNPLFTADYDYGAQAFQNHTTDIDLGARTYEYNSLGELTGMVDAKNQHFSFAYDPLSRMTSRTDVHEGVTTTWTWGSNPANHNIGKLENVSMPGYSESYTYDGVGRVTGQTVTADQSYTINFAYTSQGLLDTLTYPTSTSSVRVKVKYGYQNGLLQKVTDWTSGSAGTVYWTANSRNWSGQTTQETLGNGIKTTRSFDAVTGWLSSIQSGVGGGAGRQNESYLYDKVGNVTQRQEGNLGLTESFWYDDLHRLNYSTLGGATNLSLTYDDMGNITSKTGVGAYDYTTPQSGCSYHTNAQPHAVRKAGSAVYCYDANGNMQSRNGATITWSSYNYPTNLSTGSESTDFYYDPDRQYYKQVYSGPSGTETTHYIGGVLEKSTNGSITDWRHYIGAEGQVVAIVSRRSSGADAVHYPLENNQGSTAVLTNSSGGLTVRESFGAFGLPRDGSSWSGAISSGDQSTIAGISRRGYTGHSMLGAMGLIHMNGRVQDAVTGRFLSPDPTIPHPGFTQSYNRYAYVNNNPLSYIDPSGFADEVVITGERYRCPISGEWCNESEYRRQVSLHTCVNFFEITCVTSAELMARRRAEMWGHYRDGFGQIPLSPLAPVTTLAVTPNLFVGGDHTSGPPQGDGFGLKDAASLGVGFTPAGTLADLCTAARGKDCITGEKVGWFWRLAGIVPLASEARKGGGIIEKIAEWVGPKSTMQKIEGGSDLILRSADGTRQIRFDITNPHGLAPHVNVETFEPRNLFPGDRKMIQTSPDTHVFPRP